MAHINHMALLLGQRWNVEGIGTIIMITKMIGE